MDKYAKLRAFAQRDTALSHLLLFSFHFMRHWWSQVLISVIGTIIIALFIGFQKINFWFIISCAIYLVLLIGTAFCKEYDKSVLKEKSRDVALYSKNLDQKTKEAKMLNETLMSMTTVMSVGSKHIYRVARDIKYNGWEKKLEDFREEYSFQIEAIAICQEVYKIIQQHFGMTSHWVTIYQRFENNKTDYCKMIGYYNSGFQEPSSYHNVYKLKHEKKKKVELHTRLLTKSESSIEILSNAQEIQENFRFHRESEEREKKLQQYIGIAETVCNRNATILLQIDTNIENGFGSTKDEIMCFVQTYIKPYMILLTMHYENNRLFEMCYNRAVERTRTTFELEEPINEESDS